MEGRDFALAVFADDFGLDDERNPVLAVIPPSFQSEHGEAAWKARDTAKDGLEALGEMMGDKVLKDLDSGDPRRAFVGYPGLPTDAHDHLIMVHAIYKGFERFGEHLGICIHLCRR